ncbi:hypothetical protein S245_020226 [Arachis hypogaea]
MGESELPPVSLPNEIHKHQISECIVQCWAHVWGSFAYVMKGVSMSLKQLILEIMASWMVTRLVNV